MQPYQRKRKVVIVGGGIAGLSAAHFLSQYPDIETTLYEKEDDVGGQARSAMGKWCFTEYSWRIFGASYRNLNRIIAQIGADGNFTTLRSCLSDAQSLRHEALGSWTILTQALAEEPTNKRKWKLLNRILRVAMICRERAINDYDHVNAMAYFQQNEIFRTVMGPFLGLEANRISLSAFLHNLLSVSEPNDHQTTRITKGPTQQALFDPWKAYLLRKGVRIRTNCPLTDIQIDETTKQISSVVLGGRRVMADAYIFACFASSSPGVTPTQSVPPNTDILSVYSSTPSLAFQSTIQGLRRLARTCEQLYYTVNLYFSVTMGEDCSELVLVDMPWKPIIQRKVHWRRKSNVLSVCDPRIKEVWNVGFLDGNVGKWTRRPVSQCTKKEAVTEGIRQIAESNFVRSGQLFRCSSEMPPQEVFYASLLGWEDWYQFQQDTKGHIVTLNPKFSVNVGSRSSMPTAHPKDLPKNMFLAGAYVRSTMGGVSMEAACETGLRAAECLIKKHGLTSPRPGSFPITHSREELSLLLWPLTVVDKGLRKCGIRPLTTWIPSVLLLVIYVGLLVWGVWAGVKLLLVGI